MPGQKAAPRHRDDSTDPDSPQAPSTIELETEAIVDLVAQMRRLRRRAALPFLVGAAAAGNLGLVAHAAGYWSVLGTLLDGEYVVSKVTLMLAFLVPFAPILVLGVPVYGVMRAHTRRQWREEHRSRGLAEEWLTSTQERFP